jgi:hypothetical protein
MARDPLKPKNEIIHYAGKFPNLWENACGSKSENSSIATARVNCPECIKIINRLYPN